MQLRYLIPTLALALVVQAEPEVKPQPAPGEIILVQFTYVELKDGKPVRTNRGMEVHMRDPNGVTWRLNPMASWALRTGDNTTSIDPMRFNGPRLPGQARDMEALGFAPRRPLDHGFFDKRVEDGVVIAGEWGTSEMGPTRTKARWVERRESWWRADTTPNGEKKIRIHRTVVESPYRKETRDYFYLQTTRLHPSLFSAEDNP
jgi:hypothetical protein